MLQRVTWENALERLSDLNERGLPVSMDTRKQIAFTLVALFSPATPDEMVTMQRDALDAIGHIEGIET